MLKVKRTNAVAVVAMTNSENSVKRDIKEGVERLNLVQQEMLADLVTRRANFFFKSFLADYDCLDGDDLEKVLELTRTLKAKHTSR